MTSDEQQVLDYLKASPGVFISPKEITRRAGGKAKAAEKHDWARPAIRSLFSKGLIECDDMGRCRFVPEEARGSLKNAPKKGDSES
jgi:hypothetical protein